MFKLKPGAVAREVVDAAKSTLDDFHDGTIAGETSMTDRLVGAIRTALDGKHIGNHTWKARTLKTARGKGAEEKRHGADVLGVLQIDLPDYKTTKGFLWQAKIIEPGNPLPSAEWERFQKQCKTMLSRTDEAFAVIYSRTHGVRFIPASVILKINQSQVYEVGSRSLFGFFKGYVKCEIGDRALDSPTIETLERIAKQREVPADFSDERVLAMKVT
jgi:hypothetical protein